jgi:hypothetical protein
MPCTGVAAASDYDKRPISEDNCIKKAADSAVIMQGLALGDCRQSGGPAGVSSLSDNGIIWPRIRTG